MTLPSSTGFNCHYCWYVERKTTSDGNSNNAGGAVVVNLSGGGIPRDYRYVCPEHLFNAVRDGKLLISESGSEPQAFSDTEEDADWMCYVCNETQPRVGHFREPPLSTHNWQFSCENCLMRGVISGQLVVSMGDTSTTEVTEAAPTGPTATYDKETGDVKIDGATFRW